MLAIARLLLRFLPGLARKPTLIHFNIILSSYLLFFRLVILQRILKGTKLPMPMPFFIDFFDEIMRRIGPNMAVLKDLWPYSQPSWFKDFFLRDRKFLIFYLVKRNK